MAIAPTSYQGPMEHDDANKHTHSQTDDWSAGMSAPGLTVDAILGDKGDAAYTVAPHTTVREVISNLTRLKIGALVVVNPENEPVGILSERDIIHKLDQVGISIIDGPAEAVMTKDPVTCTRETKIEEARKIMSNRRFRHLPVVEDGKLIAVISLGDIGKHRMREIEYENLKIMQAMVG